MLERKKLTSRSPGDFLVRCRRTYVFNKKKYKVWFPSAVVILLLINHTNINYQLFKGYKNTIVDFIFSLHKQDKFYKIQERKCYKGDNLSPNFNVGFLCVIRTENARIGLSMQYLYKLNNVLLLFICIKLVLGLT